MNTERAIRYFESMLVHCDNSENRALCNVVLPALRAQQEQEKGCEYCIMDSEGFGRNIIGDAKSDEGVYFSDNPGGKMTLVQNYKYTDSAAVNFCPMCGRRLEPKEATHDNP